MFLTIITPTYNRGYLLHNIYKTLISDQNKDNFEWIIVDDGSTDNTESIVKSFDNNTINIKYIKKENSGKTNALLTAFALDLKGDYCLVLDSDDILVDNFYDIIEDEITKVNGIFQGYSFLKSDFNGNIIGEKFKQDEANYVEMYFGSHRTLGDKMFVVKSNTYKEALVRSFPNEKLIPESVFYLNMSKKGKFRCVNKILYMGDYLSDGLSFDIEKLAAKNINGFIYEKQLLQKEDLSLVDRIKNEIKYIAYSFAGDKSIQTIIKESNSKILSLFLLLPSYFLAYRKIKNIKMIRDENK